MSTSDVIRENARMIRHTANETLNQAEFLFERATELKRKADEMDARADEIDDVDEVRALAGPDVVVDITDKMRSARKWKRG